MNWSIKIGKEKVQLNLAESVTAVSLGPTLPSLNLASEILGLGASIAHESLSAAFEVDIRKSDLDAFKNAGWHFMKSPQQIAFAAEFRAPLPHETTARQVYVSESGDLLVGTNLASVQLHPDLDKIEVLEILAQDGLEMVYQFRFAPNTFEVSLPRDRPMLEVVAHLQEKEERYLFAEPTLLQAITGRFRPADPRFSEQWQHQDQSVSVNAAAGICSEKAWDKTRGIDKNGRPVRIAIIDNGMQISHPDLQAGVVACARFDLDADGKVTFRKLQPGQSGFPEQNDHGTFCMGMAGARMNHFNESGQGGCGSAPEADMIAIACAPGLVGTQNALARAVQYAADPLSEDHEADPKDGADVISCSLKTAQLDFSTLKQAIEFAAAKGRNGLGTPILWAVSNDHVQIELDKVCSHPDVIAVGRSTKEGQISGSAFGDELAFLAPGVSVFSTRAHGLYDNETGTSFATPLAAGVAALVLACHPEFDVNQVRGKLIASCDQINGATGHFPESGFGILNASRAVSD